MQEIVERNGGFKALMTNGVRSMSGNLFQFEVPEIHEKNFFSVLSLVFVRVFCEMTSICTSCEIFQR